MRSDRQPAIPASVPGCVHTDLLAQGLIPDPYLDDNELGTAWIGRTDWTYETAFDWTPGPDRRLDLVCAGLDTVATITLNGTEIGRTANMHREYRFDLRPAVRPGRNELRIDFESAYAYTERMRALVGDRPGAYDEPYQFIRKMACNFGWDWGPTLVTAGIWRPIGLHPWSVARLAAVRANAAPGDDGGGRVEVRVELDRDTDEPVTVTAAVAGVAESVTIPGGGHDATLTLAVERAEPWWPRGYGDQPLYELSVSLAAADGSPLDHQTRRIGFRDIRLDTEPDADGTPFTLVVNGVPVFVKGVNWIPDDAFVSRVSRERLAGRFAQAADANINYLRIWGGGIYESDDFYDLADELGLLVGQDFLFACAAYPEEEPFAAEVAAEARDNVTRLAHHPSLVLWTGNNENIWGYHDWDWQGTLAGRTWGAGFYHELLPRITAELDPARPYWPGSPYSGDPAIHPNDPAHGTTHQWEVWNRIDYVHYRDDRPRFVAEYGYQAPPAYATLRRSISDAVLAPDSPGMAHHQKAADGDLKLRRGLAAHLPPPQDFDDWHYLTQLNQARAITLGIEHYRSLQPLCMGSIVWQLNDCWPVTSWAAVDGDGRRKPLWYALRAAYADRLLAIVPTTAALGPATPGTGGALGDGAHGSDTAGNGARPGGDADALADGTGGNGTATTSARGDGEADALGDGTAGGGALMLAAMNDTAEPWTGLAEVTAYALDGTALAGTKLEVSAGPRSVALIPLPGLTAPGDTAGTDAEAEAVAKAVAGAQADAGAYAMAAAGAKAGVGAVALRARLGEATTWWFLAEDKDIDYPAARYTAEVLPVPDGYQVAVTAATILRDLTLYPDRLDPAAEVDQAMITLLPGETATFTVRTAASLDPTALTSRPVLRCVNDLAVAEHG